MALSKLTLTTLKPAQNPSPEELKIQNFSGGACPQTTLESACFARSNRISVCSSGLSTFYLLPTGLVRDESIMLFFSPIMQFSRNVHYAEESAHYTRFLQHNALFSRLQTRIANFARSQKA